MVNMSSGTMSMSTSANANANASASTSRSTPSYASAASGGGPSLRSSPNAEKEDSRLNLFHPPPSSMTLMAALLLLDSPLSPLYSEPSIQSTISPEKETHTFLLSRYYLQNWLCWAYHQPVPPEEETRVKLALCMAAKDHVLKSPGHLPISYEYQDPGPIDSVPLSFLGHPLLLRPNVVVGRSEAGAKQDNFSLNSAIPMGRAQSFSGAPTSSSAQNNAAGSSPMQNRTSTTNVSSRTDEQVGCCAVPEGFYELLRSVHGVLCDDGVSVSFQSFENSKTKFTMHHHFHASFAAAATTKQHPDAGPGASAATTEKNSFSLSSSSSQGKSLPQKISSNVAAIPTFPHPVEFRRKVLHVAESKDANRLTGETPESKLMNYKPPKIVPTVEVYPIKFFYSLIDTDRTISPAPSITESEHSNTPSSALHGTADHPSTVALLNAAASDLKLVNSSTKKPVELQQLELNQPRLGFRPASMSAPSSPMYESSDHRYPAAGKPPPIRQLRTRTNGLPGYSKEDAYSPLGFILVSRTSPLKDVLREISKVIAPDQASSCVRLWKKVDTFREGSSEKATVDGDGFELIDLATLDGKLLRTKGDDKKKKPQSVTTVAPLTVGEWVKRQGRDNCKSIALLLETRSSPNSKWGRESLELEHRIKVGDFVDAQDTTGKWYEAIVRKVTKNTLTVHYAGWASRWNSTLRRSRSGDPILGTPTLVNSPAPLWSHTSLWRDNIKVGQEIEIRESASLVQRPKWFRGIVKKLGTEGAPVIDLVCGAELDQLEDDGIDGEQVNGKPNKTCLLLLGRKRQILVEVPQERNTTCTASIPPNSKNGLRNHHQDEDQQYPSLRWVNLFGEEICQSGTHLEVKNKSEPAIVSYTYGARKEPVEVLKSFNNIHGSGFVRESLRGVPPAPGSVGLQNLGNSCFLNSIIQCLNHTEPLMQFFLKGAYVKDLNRRNPLGSGGRVAVAFASLLGEIWSGDFSILAPRMLKQTVASFAPQFNNIYQHDSQEFCSFLMDGIHEDLNRVIEKPYVEELEGRGMVDEMAAIESWRKHILRHDSIIVDHFQGMHRSHLTCPQCGRESIKFDVYSTVSLPIPSEKSGPSFSLEECMENFEVGEQLDEHNAWYCPKCQKHVCALKMIALWSVPDIMVFHLKRFQYDACTKTGGVVKSKMNETIEFPIENLDMSPYILGPVDKEKPPIYRLHGVSEHSGSSANSGHYTATVRNSKDGKWYRYNDSHVGVTSGEASVTGNAYLLFYQRSTGVSRWGGMEKAMKEYGIDPFGGGNIDKDGFTQVKMRKKKKVQRAHRS